MLKSFFAKNKRKVWPEFKDWSSPMNHMRHNNNIKEMKLTDWIWFHPSCYKLIHLGTFPIVAASFSLLIIYFLLRGSANILLLLPAIMVGYSFMQGKKRIQQRKNIEGMTFYDVFLRE